jgi:hypothetical protein
VGLVTQVTSTRVNIFEITAIRFFFISRVLLAIPQTRGGVHACQQVRFAASCIRSLCGTAGEDCATRKTNGQNEWPLAQTFQQSARLLYMLLFFATLALLINSSVLYYLERGTYSPEAKVLFTGDPECFQCGYYVAM